MSSRSFEITILSAENLRTNKTSIKKNVFVKIQTDGNGEVRTTKVNGEGGSYPSWNEKVVMHGSSIACKVNRNGVINISVRVKMPEISSLLPPAINGLPAQGVPVTGKSSNAL
ncbi:BON1-associated protein 2-like [Arachis hypogaea]|nr:BON1-associated protein 2-like [Arachis hypogaea]